MAEQPQPMGKVREAARWAARRSEKETHPSARAAQAIQRSLVRYTEINTCYRLLEGPGAVAGPVYLQAVVAAAARSLLQQDNKSKCRVQFTRMAVPGIGAIFKDPVGDPVYLETAGSTPAFYTEGSANMNALEASWDLELNLQAGAPVPQQLRAPMKAMAVANAAPNAVYTIIPVHVPNEAVGVSFEYQITGGGNGEFMTMGIGEENSYTMEAELVEDGGWNGTPVLAISDHANQVQLVFALNGAGAPPTGTLGIRNIQFYIPPRPQLELQVAGPQLTVFWPLSALDWTLESTTNLSDPNSWQPVNATPVDRDYFHTQTFDITPTDRAFFRLKK